MLATRHSALINAVNTNRDGTGAAQLITKIDGPAWIESVTFRPLGDNAAALGLFIINNGSDRDVASNNDLLTLTLPAISTASATVAAAPVALTVEQYVEDGWRLYGAVSVDLVSDAGYVASVKLGNVRADHNAA